MTEHPEDIIAADAAQLRRIGKLGKGMKVDPNGYQTHPKTKLLAELRSREAS